MYHVTNVSGNKKTGPIPVTTSTKSTCPSTCPLYEKGCYSKGGPLAIHWSKITKGERGVEFVEFCKSIRLLPKGQLWRHNQAGDLPGEDTEIDKAKLEQLTKANKGKRGFTYTHKPVENHRHAVANRTAIAEANKTEFTINLSANNLEQADRYYDLGIGPVCTLLPEDSPKKILTNKKRRVVVCPAQLDKTNRVNCSNCQLCQRKDRDFIIGFLAHGSARKHVSTLAKGEPCQKNQT